MNWWLKKTEFDQLVADAKVLEEQSFGVKVYLLRDRRIMKLFRIKHPLRGSMLYPYSFRFAHNARHLKRLGINTVDVEHIFYYHPLRNHGVIYPLLEGTPVSLMLDDENPESLARALAAFYAQLHELGIYFRSVHPGNILQLPNGEFGLIDIADMKFKSRPLGYRERIRNFRHLLRSDDHSPSLLSYSAKRFAEHYIEALPNGQDRFPELVTRVEQVAQEFEGNKLH
ncbi:MAG: hypothetical protein ACWA5Q_00060 [bacterium]